MVVDWNKFNESPLSVGLKKHLEALNIDRPSPIQKKLINSILTPDGERIRRNVFACSPTGTGKTLAYVLPLLHFLNKDIRPYYALVLAPTRELAYQIHEIVNVLAGSKAKSTSSTMIKTQLLIGGGRAKKKIKNESEMQGFWGGKPNIVIATPGKLAEELTRHNFSDETGHRSALRFDFLVLDEADILIGPTFANQLKEVLQAIDEHSAHNKEAHHRQTIVLSATLTSALESLQKMFSTTDDETLKPIMIDLLPSKDEMKLEIAHNPNLEQRYLICPEAMKPAYLAQCLSDISFKQVIIFCSSSRQSVILHRLMMNLGFDEKEVKCHPVLLVGSKNQQDRLEALEAFKSLKSRILIATAGLVGRGLDLPQVDLVILYSCPKNPVDYIHQVGRTSRKIDFARIDDLEKIRANITSLKKLKDCVNTSKFIEENELVGGDRAKSEVTVTQTEHKLKRAKLSKAASKYYGKSVLFITQYDIGLLKNIESYAQIRLDEEDEVDLRHINGILKPVALALKEAELSVIDEEAAARDARKR